MSLELRVSGGALDGHRALFDQESILVGRDPHADVRLDPVRDRDVSTRHAEIRRRDGRWLVRDLNSTNGTFLNGERVSGEVALRDGDRIGCGASGPVLVVTLVGEPADAAAEPRTVLRGAPSAPPRRSSGAQRARPSGAARAGGSGPARRAAVAVGALLVLGLAGGFVVAQRRTAARLAEVDAMLRRADSIRVAAERNAAALSGQLAGLDSALASERQRTAELLSGLREAQSSGRPAAARDLARQLDEAAQRQAQLAALAGFDYARVAAANQRAVALIAVEKPDGSAESGTAFGVNPRGLLVTNRHVVDGEGGAAPRRIAVKFADTDRWLPARLVRADERADLATVQVEGEGPFPSVQGIAASPRAAGTGSPVALIGYPLGLDTPMDRTEGDFIARASLFGGMVSKLTDGVVQIDAYAGHGSSGSPVFDRRGAVVGVVFGGARESNGRIVYAVSTDRLHALLPEGTARRM